MSRRRFMGDKHPILIKLTNNPGSNQNYSFLPGYKYVDMLIVGGGAAGYKDGGDGGQISNENGTSGSYGAGGGGGHSGGNGGNGGQGIICLYYHN